MAWFGNAAKRELRERAARGLLAAAVYLQQQHQAALGIPNPPPHRNSSKPGQYPRKRTGFGQAHTVYRPTTVGQIIRNKMSVEVGYTKNAWYMLHLEVALGRRGIAYTQKRFRRQLAAFAEEAMKSGGSRGRS